jgi:hypothetical protein
VSKITYNYRIVAVGDRTMDVEYTNETYGTMLVGVRRPLVGETVESVIAQFSPALFWAEQAAPVQEVAVGRVGGGETVVQPEIVVLSPAEQLALDRSRMAVSPLQGILTLGETEWGKVLAYRDGLNELGEPFASWQEKVIIDSAQDWQRNSQNIAFFGHLLDYAPEQMDALFAAAMQVKA